jgi:hypothetical protein
MSPGRETTFRLPSNRTQVENAEQEAALANGGEALIKGYWFRRYTGRPALELLFLASISYLPAARGNRAANPALNLPAPVEAPHPKRAREQYQAGRFWQPSVHPMPGEPT